MAEKSIGVMLEDGTSIHFIQDHYKIQFEGRSATFTLKPEFKHARRPERIILNFGSLYFTEQYCDKGTGWYNATYEKFKGVI
jgi:hypothetical protein